MCARYTVFTEDEIFEIRAIINEVSRKFGDGAVSVGEIYPTNTAAILTLEDHRLTPSLVAWGFPKWDGKGVIVNARCESALQKSMFAGPLLSRRCVIPSTGYYEWTAEENLGQQLSLFAEPTKAKGSKVKLLFRRPGEAMLYMAGMISSFTDADGVTKDCFVILTTAANAAMSPFHDRMPVILAPGECEDWIENDTFMREVLAREDAELVWSR